MSILTSTASFSVAGCCPLCGDFCRCITTQQPLNITGVNLSYNLETERTGTPPPDECNLYRLNSGSYFLPKNSCTGTTTRTILTCVLYPEPQVIGNSLNPYYRRYGCTIICDLINNIYKWTIQIGYSYLSNTYVSEKCSYLIDVRDISSPSSPVSNQSGSGWFSAPDCYNWDCWMQIYQTGTYGGSYSIRRYMEATVTLVYV